MSRLRTVHATAAILAGVAIAFFITNHPAIAGIILSIEAVLVVWSIESTRNAPAAPPEKRS